MSYIIKLIKPKFSVIYQAFCSVHQLVQLILAHSHPKSQLPTHHPCWGYLYTGIGVLFALCEHLFVHDGPAPL